MSNPYSNLCQTYTRILLLAPANYLLTASTSLSKRSRRRLRPRKSLKENIIWGDICWCGVPFCLFSVADLLRWMPSMCHFTSLWPGDGTPSRWKLRFCALSMNCGTESAFSMYDTSRRGFDLAKRTVGVVLFLSLLQKHKCKFIHKYELLWGKAQFNTSFLFTFSFVYTL